MEETKHTMGTEAVVRDEYMRTEIYDPNGDGIVEKALTAGAAELAVNATKFGDRSPIYYAAKEDVSGLQGTVNGLIGLIGRASDKADTALAGLTGKVDKVAGKGLSTEDYTPAEKAKLASVEEGVIAEPAGSIKLFAGSALPGGYLWCDGTSYLKAGDYAKLYSVIGIAYNKPETISEHFCVPDMRGRVGVGKNNGIFDALGKTGGEEKSVLAANDIPQVSTGIYPQNAGGTLSGGYSIYGNTNSGNPYYTAGSAKPQPHNNLQPYLVCNYIIKY